MANQNKAYELAAKAKKCDDARDWRGAEQNYLLAAQELASSKLKEDVANRRQWDAAAKRARRLSTLEVVS